MALELFTTGLDVDATSSNRYSSDTGAPFLVKNFGRNIVYVGRIPRNSPGTVFPLSGYPLLPGEEVTVPAYDTELAGSTYTVGFNTESGASVVRILDLRSF